MNCKHCGKEIKPLFTFGRRRPRARNYCNKDCSNAAHEKRTREALRLARRKCAHCGEDLNERPGPYCSDVCRGIAFRGCRTHGEQDLSTAQIDEILRQEEAKRRQHRFGSIDAWHTRRDW